jgi:hypothetical protein
LQSTKGEKVTQNRNHRIKALIAAAVVLALSVAAVATAAKLAKFIVKDPQHNLEATFEGGASPKALPKHGRAPVSLTLNGTLKSLDGSHLAAVDKISLDFDKAGNLFTKGLSSCRERQLEATTTATAKRSCGKALVGTGKVTADIAFPEQSPLHASGPLLVFNASKGVKQELLLHVYAHVPAATTFVVPVKIKKEHGKFGTNAFIKVPKIVSGQGSVTSFKAKIKKLWNYRHKKRSLLNAGCPRGKLSVRGDLKFVGGADLKGEINAPCKPKG